MKNTITTIVLVAAIIAAFFIGKSCGDNSENYKQKIAKLDEQIKGKDSLIQLVNVALNKKELAYDSLEEVKQKTKIITINQVATIDSNIASDSTRAIPEYRASLTELGWLPDNADWLTYREIGIGAKEMRLKWGMSLELYDEQQQNIILKAQINDWRNKFDLSGGKYDLCVIKNLELQKVIKQKDSFWYHRWGVYTGVGASYSASGKLEPSLQVGVGVFIWRNE